ncbi:MAG TPA: TIGR04255 family protein [Spirochaetes bacterium]|nr:TIGR04255 family protein [Spirochaetota bacterium]
MGYCYSVKNKIGNIFILYRMVENKQKYQIFSKAPIKEALLDIRVQLKPEIKLTDLLEFQEAIKDQYPDRKERKFAKYGFQVVPKPSAHLDKSGTDGYLFKSSNGEKVVQARLDGFTFNKLKPYESWKDLRDESQQLWSIYTKTVNPVKVQRIALRYINRLEVPLPIKEFRDYILTSLDIPENLPQAVSNFFIRLEMPYHEIGAIAIVMHTIEPPTKDNKLPMIFDIDVSKEVDYETESVAIWEDFEKLRIIKNEVFFNSITDKTKELIK